MNWVGGSRKRLMMKDDNRRQREFFERTKMQQRLKKMGVPVPGCPTGSTSISLDLVTLFVVNQIASKKESKAIYIGFSDNQREDAIKVKYTYKPPKVALFGSSKDLRKKRNQPVVLPMSPGSPSQLSLMDSQSRSSFQAPPKKYVIPQTFKCQQLSPVLESAFSDISASDYLRCSPFSTNSPASSGRFSLQLNPPQRSQQSSICEPSPWETSGLEQPVFQPFSEPRAMCDGASWTTRSTLFQRHSPSAVLFGEPQLDSVEKEHPEGADFSLDQALYQEPTLEFINAQETDNEQPFVEDVFRGFSNGDYGDTGTPKAKSYLDNITPANVLTPQTVPDTENMREELTDRAKLNCAYNGQTTNCGHSSPSCCRTGGCSSSDSSDFEVCCQPAEERCRDQNLHSPGSQRSSSLNPLTPQSFTRGYPKNHRTLLSQTCSKCRTTTNPLQDSGTQTDATVEKSDAGTQYDLQTHQSIMSPPPLDGFISLSATGGQAGCTDKDRSEENFQNNSEQTDIFTQSRCSRSILQKHIKSLEDHVRGQQPGLAQLEKDEKVKMDLTSANRSHRLPEESETLQDIAKILLLLKQRMKEE